MRSALSLSLLGDRMGLLSICAICFFSEPFSFLLSDRFPRKAFTLATCECSFSGYDALLLPDVFPLSRREQTRVSICQRFSSTLFPFPCGLALLFALRLVGCPFPTNASFFQKSLGIPSLFFLFVVEISSCRATFLKIDSLHAVFPSSH